MKSIINQSTHLILVALFATLFSSLAFAGGSESGDKGLFVPVGGSESGDKGLFVPQSYEYSHHEVEILNMKDLVLKASHVLSGGSLERAEYIQGLYSEFVALKVFENLGGQKYIKSIKSYELIIEASLYAAILLDNNHVDNIQTAVQMSISVYSDKFRLNESI